MARATQRRPYFHSLTKIRDYERPAVSRAATLRSPALPNAVADVATPLPFSTSENPAPGIVGVGSVGVNTDRFNVVFAAIFGAYWKIIPILNAATMIQPNSTR